MASVKNNLIHFPVILGGRSKSHSVKVSARQYRQIERFCNRTDWTADEVMSDAVDLWLEIVVPAEEQRTERA